MADPSIGRRYARAFVELAEEIGQVDKLGDDLAKVLSLVRSGDGLLFGALCNPVFTTAERLSVLKSVLTRTAIHPLSRNLLLLLLEKNRFAALPDVVKQYRADADEHAGRVRVLVETAIPLTPPLETEIRAVLENVTHKTVLLDTHVVPSLIGGLVARIGGKVIDASVRTRLEDIKQRLLSTRVPADA